MIKCPLLDQDIDIGDCVTTVDCCDGVVKENVINQEILKNKNWREICEECEHHNN